MQPGRRSLLLHGSRGRPHHAPCQARWAHRGRDDHYWPPPAQIRTRPTKASGSYLGCLTSKLAVRGLAPGSHVPGPVSGVCFAVPRSPWSPALAPPAPPPVARLCSSASLLLCRSQTSLGRASAATAPHLPATDHPTPTGPWPIQRSPGSRTRSVRTCQGLRPRRVRRRSEERRVGKETSSGWMTSASEAKNELRLSLR